MEYKRYLNIFNSQSDYESQKDEVMDMPHVVLLEDTNEVIFASKNKEIDYASQPFTLVALEDGTMNIAMHYGATSMHYALNDGDWVEMTKAVSLTMNGNDKVKIKAIGTSFYSECSSIFSSSMPFNAEGNIMSLLYGDDFQDKTSLEGMDEECFMSLFMETNIVSAKNLILPATTLTVDCYGSMFEGCVILVEAPQLPATTLAEYCYNGMFYGCTSLTTAPELLATTLAQSCYYYMFRDCTSLVEAPQLPATTLANKCYYLMFYGCTNLTTAPELPATILAEQCYYSMFNGCSSLNKITMLATDINAYQCLVRWVEGVASNGTFVKNAAMTSLSSGRNGIPEGWTVQNY